MSHLSVGLPNLRFLVWFGTSWSLIEALGHLSAESTGSLPQVILYVLHLFIIHGILVSFIGLMVSIPLLALFSTGKKVFLFKWLLLAICLAVSFGLARAAGSLVHFFTLTFPLCTVACLLFTGKGLKRSVRFGIPVFLLLLVALTVFKVYPLISDAIPITSKPTNITPDQPNCILISVDTLRADHLGCYGHPLIRTPNIDRLARFSSLFDQVITPQALTGPAHASMLSGQYPLEHGCRSNGDPVKHPGSSLASVLSGKGYTTAAFVSGYPLKKEFFAYHQHFHSYHDKFSPDWFPGDTIFKVPLVSLLANHGLVYDRRYLFERSGELLNRTVEKFVTHCPGPFFLFIHYYEPHGPYEPPRHWRDYYYSRNLDPGHGQSMQNIVFPAYQRLRKIGDINYPKAMYKGEVSHVDALIGQLVHQKLPRQLMTRTMIVLTADHGESLGEHGYYFDHGRDCFQPGLHVPLLLHYPGERMISFNSGFTSLTEVPALILSRLGHNGNMTGRVPDIHSSHPETGLEQHRPVPLEANSNLLRHSDAGKKLEIEQFARAIIFGDMKYYEDIKARQSFLFDLKHDPAELHDVSPENSETVRLLQRGLNDWEATGQGKHSIIDGLSDDQINELEQLGYIHE